MPSVDVEDELLTISAAVAEVAVVGVKSRVVCFVTLRRKAVGSVTEADLKEHFTSKLAERDFHVDEVRIVSTLPTSLT